MPRLASCRILVVGAGGIGCELLKNLVLTGFEDLEVVSMSCVLWPSPRQVACVSSLFV